VLTKSEKAHAARKRWEAKNPGYWKARYIREKETHNARMQKWYLKNRASALARQRKNALMKKYGLTYEAYVQLLADHGNKCAICGDGRKLVIDHDHVTGAVRGILCDGCNVGVGRFGDNPALVYKAAMYLAARHTAMREVS